MLETYILDATNRPVSVSGVKSYTWRRDNFERCRVGLDMVNGYRISTVFLGYNQALFGGEEQLFETMVFLGDSWEDLCVERYATFDEAVAGHARIMELVKAGEYEWNK